MERSRIGRQEAAAGDSPHEKAIQENVDGLTRVSGAQMCQQKGPMKRMREKQWCDQDGDEDVNDKKRTQMMREMSEQEEEGGCRAKM